jgi:hypothetical protein
VDCPPTRTAEAQPYQTPHRSCPASVHEFHTFISPTINHFRQIRPILRTSEPYTHAISEFPGGLYLMPEPNTQATGPRTEAGKATSSMNALRHGLSITRHVILKHEDAAEFETLARELHSIFEPQSPRERLAVEEITHCKWALRRFERAEAFMLEFPATPHRNDQQDIPAEHKLGYITTLSDQKGEAHSAFLGIHNLLRYRGHWDRRHQRALAEFDRAQRARRADARERRQEREDQRKQELHELRCELLKAKISASRKPKQTNRQPGKQHENQFVSSDPQTSQIPHPQTPPNPGLAA